MRLINNTSTNPYFNIAAEEYLLKESSEDIFMHYIDEPSIIVGKHQNTLAEINLRFTVDNNIPVIRRISGGGAVYHDKGNLNFTFITNGKEGHLIDFRRFTKPIMDVLQNFDLDVKFEGKNNLCVKGLKISGNAERVYKNRVLHHGTLLISTDLKTLSAALHVAPGKYFDNAIKSIRSSVVNINNTLHPSMNIGSLRDNFFAHIRQIQRSEDYSFSTDDIGKIKKLVTQKFSTWEWNFGYSPPYEFRNKAIIQGKETEIYLKVEKGIIDEVHIGSFKKIQEVILGIRHYYPEIQKALKTALNLNEEESQELAWYFF